jgi:hypothetical protein
MSRTPDLSSAAGLVRLLRREGALDGGGALGEVRGGVPAGTVFRVRGVSRDVSEGWLRRGAEDAAAGKRTSERELWELVDVAEAVWETRTIASIQEEVGKGKAPAAKVLLEMLQRRFVHWAPVRVESDEGLSLEEELARIQARRAVERSGS